MQAYPAAPVTEAIPTSDADLRTRSQSSIPTRELFNGTQEILIDHQGETYRLRITRNGKLILTK